MNDKNGIEIKLTDEEKTLYQERLINFTIYSQKVRAINSKKPRKTFEITCSDASLAGKCNNQNDIKVKVTAVTIDGAKMIFELDPGNQGLIFQSIREIE